MFDPNRTAGETGLKENRTENANWVKKRELKTCKYFHLQVSFGSSVNTFIENANWVKKKIEKCKYSHLQASFGSSVNTFTNKFGGRMGASDLSSMGAAMLVDFFH